MPCCAANGSTDVLTALRRARDQNGLIASVYVTASGCLGPCPRAGTTIVVYPEAVWYTGVTADDVTEIVESHMLGGRAVERLRDPQWRLRD